MQTVRCSCTQNLLVQGQEETWLLLLIRLPVQTFLLLVDRYNVFAKKRCYWGREAVLCHLLRGQGVGIY